jgi:hypothetical protein
MMRSVASWPRAAMPGVMMATSAVGFFRRYRRAFECTALRGRPLRFSRNLRIADAIGPTRRTKRFDMMMLRLRR